MKIVHKHYHSWNLDHGKYYSCPCGARKYVGILADHIKEAK